MKTKQILRSELKDKIKTGDLIYCYDTEDMKDHKGWRIISDRYSIGLNTKMYSFSNNLEHNFNACTKCIIVDEVKYLGNLSEFFHTYDESIIQDYIYEVVDAIKSEEDLKIEELEKEIVKMINELRKLKKENYVDAKDLHGNKEILCLNLLL